MAPFIPPRGKEQRLALKQLQAASARLETATQKLITHNYQEPPPGPVGNAAWRQRQRDTDYLLARERAARNEYNRHLFAYRVSVNPTDKHHMVGVAGF